jgi:hypothetical protein
VARGQFFKAGLGEKLNVGGFLLLWQSIFTKAIE